MQQRLYFLLPDTATAEAVIDALRAARIDEDAMGVVARHDDPSESLPEAGINQTSDVAPAAARGAAAGAVTGVVAGLAAIAFPPLGIAVGGGMVAATGLAGATFGAWISSMIGIRHDSEQVAQFETAIERGEVLMMVDTDAGARDDVAAIVRRHYPEAEVVDSQSTKHASS